MSDDYSHLASAQSLLVAVDFSGQSEAALVFAAELCSLKGCRLTILHVAHERGSQPGFYTRNGQFGQILPLCDLALRMTQEFVRNVRERHPELEALDNAEILTVTGLPETRILEVAEAIPAELLILGGNGRSILSKLVKGSVAENVAKQSPIPVHVVHTNRNHMALPRLGTSPGTHAPSPDIR